MADEITKLLSLVVPILAVIVGWLWRQIRSNMEASTTNGRDIALLDQRLSSALGKVDGMEEKVIKLNEELTQVKFSILDLSHKQDQNHTELLNEIRSIRS